MPNGPDEPVPEVRVAANVATHFRFNAPIDRSSLVVEGRATRFSLVDAGDHTLTLEPAVEPGAAEKLGVRVRYKEGASPAYATFALVSHPTLVDKEVEVVRRPRTVEAVEAALAEKDAQLAALRSVSGPVGLVFSGRLDAQGVQARPIDGIPSDTPNGLKVVNGVGYRAGSWTLAAVRVQNLAGQKPWEPGQARLTHATNGLPVQVRSVGLNKARLAPGEEGLVVVEMEAPHWNSGELFRLEVLDKSGSRGLPTLDVEL